MPLANFLNGVSPDSFFESRAHKTSFLNNLMIMDQWAWQRLGLLKHLFNGDCIGLCTFQIALTAVVLLELV